MSRLTGVHQDTISRFALAAGTGAGYLHNRLARGLSCTLIETDELWTYCGVKEARKAAEHPVGFGDVWVWVAVCGVSRMVISWHAGRRDQASADAFMSDVRARLTVMPQITSDGYAAYGPAIGKAFGFGVDHGQVVKSWQKGGQKSPDHKYEPPRDPKLTKRTVFGAPNLATSTTAHVERNNLTIRHMNGRLRRLCLAFSKRPENHAAALALSYCWFNLGRVQKDMKVTPAMAADITDHVWELDEFLTAIMTAERCGPPVQQDLAPRTPETTHRELPGGRGFLRIVEGGTGKGAPPAPTPEGPAPAHGAQVSAPGASPVAAPDENEQLDLFSWRPKGPPKGRKPPPIDLF
ncbi:IS1 family transposase [Polyangium jinanense]|uniref:IS1 family transposase n=1 Tax=Polyangium jinanense TaxID=2829994 RepID=A0A9X3XFJ8_9BACT|nr:transposase [Polyangium jinanense]MDC3962536.1 IS1 family transposase [Polyangium jinanense]MDC3989357.1 IS1 family transposase [Polyangium jinanense]